ncbi:protein kinase domain-containing protein [Streptacidiphilus jiangxiensis]|uniref:non-specific serine/threonine protein kinase n=1 Tax=Streptacidiphilus jiangxiensis TaxID=235985 RepID=A0A1H7YAW1_STRJI|nr:protein kinase [Streptacidiphilus jiangxiensis]SEM42457.1 serine/threonine protein kinase [Streptacidiphilus jiangxiensis]
MDTLQPPALGDRYLLCELLGSGGMAEVYRARDLRLDRTVAVKVLRPELAADPIQRVRFGREARAAASLNHPGIVAVFDSGEGAGPHLDLPYLVMEYLPGRTLAQLLAETGPLPPRQALRAVAEVLEALDHAHRAGMVHRDVKPANVMVVEDAAATVKLMDFGIARSLGHRPGNGPGHGSAAAEQALTAVGMVIGTADYLSPEQARGESADARSDLYAVGCLLHELLTGVPPLTADTPLNTVMRRLREDPEPPSLLAPSLTPDVDALVLRALARDPAARYPDAAAMAAAVRAVAATEASGSAPTMPLGHAVTVADLPVPMPGRAGGDDDRDGSSGETFAPSGPFTVTAPGRPTAVAPQVTQAPVEAGSRRRERPRRGRGKAVAVTVAVAAVVSVGGWLALDAGSTPAAAGTTHVLPDLTGQSLSHARRELQALGLHLGHLAVGSCAGTKAAPRTVCTQSPAAGTALGHGAAVELSVSRPTGIAAGAGAP